MKTRSLLFSMCISSCTFLAVTGCSDDRFEAEQETMQTGVPFTLTAMSGDNATSRLSFEDDGLTLNWENGDQLIMQDVNFAQNPVYLTTTLETPAATAQFTSEGTVSAGEYYVYYKGKKCEIYTNDGLEVWHSPELRSNSELKDKLILLSTIKVEPSQSSATINLQHLFAKLTIKIVDSGNVLSSWDNSLGMISIGNGFYGNSVKVAKGANADEFQLTEISSKGAKQKLEYLQYVEGDDNSYYIMNITDGVTASALLLPTDLTGETIYFYIGDNQQAIAYEFAKSGINIKAGVNYNVTLDVSQATKYDLSSRKLSSTDQFRALNYLNYGDFTLTQDLDFANVQYIPITNDVSIYGDKHTISNLTINWPFDNAGLKGSGGGTVSDLTLENVTVKGQNYVGAICGNGGIIKNCQLVGDNNTIEGNNSVGGIAGYTWNEITSCGFSGSVSGQSFVGGIKGDGDGTVSLSYSTGTVTGTYRVGGIVGYGSYATVTNCYSLSDVNGSDQIGGICGFTRQAPTNCYSAGTVASKYGIVGYTNTTLSITTCLTTSTALYSDDAAEEYTLCQDILNKIDVINGENAYYTEANGVWETPAYNCPKLMWQIQTEVNSGATVPPYENQDW